LTFNFVEQVAVAARYAQHVERAGVNAGVNLTPYSDIRLDAYVSSKSASIEIGNPGFPESRGKETGAELTWRLDSQGSPVIPTRACSRKCG
jgi:hypothetical protein